MPECKRCRSLRGKQDYAVNKIDILAAAKICRQKNPLRYRASNRKYMYGISDEEYNNLLKLQDNKCACCGQEESSKYKGKTKALAVDHSHLAGNIRGLLCYKCNVALGLLDENIDKCYLLIKYILKYS